MEMLWQDMRLCARTLLKNRAFTLAVAATLALGIGANTAIFSVVNAVLLRPLPYQNSDQLVWGYGRFSLNDSASVSPPDFLDYRAQNRVFTQMAARTIGHLFTITGPDEPLLLSGNRVTSNYFETLGIAPLLGRTFRAEEERASNDGVVLLSYGLWQRRFGADRAIVGRTLTIEGAPATVIGVMPATLDATTQDQLWMPLPFGKQELTVRRFHFLRVIARLAPGVSFAQAQAQMDGIARGLEATYSENKTWSLRLVPLQEVVVGDVRTPLLLMMGAVGIVLLIACTNTANLLFARNVARQREMAIRSALGAGRSRLMRQLLAESILLALLGGGLGVLLAAWGVDVLQALEPQNLPRLQEIRVDGPVLAYALGISIFTGFLFGMLPAWRSAGGASGQLLNQGTRSTSGREHQRSRGILVAAETALSMILLAAAGLLLHSYMRLLRVDPGFRPENVLTARLLFDAERYAGDQKRGDFIARLTENLRHSLGVESVGVINSLPLALEGGDTYFTIAGRAPSRSGASLLAQERTVSPDYFHTMGIPLKRGRFINSNDRAGAPGAVLVNEAFVRQFFPSENPIGRQITIDIGKPFPAEIVGVVGDVRQFGLGMQAFAEMYRPVAQTPPYAFRVVIRISGAPARAAASLRSAVWSIDKDQAIGAISAMDEIIAGSVAPQRFQSVLLGIFGALALLLATLGLYAVTSYGVGQRAHEFGVRMALGARPVDVLRMVVRQGMHAVIVGIAIGLVGALAISRLLRDLVFGISATDPLTYVVVTLLLGLVALVACYLPARRVTKVDPLTALRYE